MISLFRVAKAYHVKYPILQDINLTIEKGEFVCLSGKSGAGKTTLLKLIFCDEFPDRGQIIVDGRNISRLTRYQIAQLRRSIGVVFQDFKLIQARSVFDNVAIALQILGVEHAAIKQRVMTMLGLVGLDKLASHLPVHLSGGEQQRVAIARALINNPKILLADEPTGNLDPALSREIVDLLKEIHLRGTTILMVSHNEELVRRINQRAIVLDQGKVG